MWSALTSGSAIIRSKSPKAILALFEPHLTERQKLELTTMNEIWYFTLDDGEEETSRGGIRNHGYDDQEHNYIPVEHEHFNYRFELGRKIGQGGQGVVVQCLDHKTQTLVALKILASPTHFKDDAYQMMELRMSMELQTVRSDVDYNVANVMHLFYFRGHKCIVMELLKKSLHQVLIERGQWRIDEDDLRSYARGIVRFLAYTKSRGIVHGDIKPGNVLLKNNSSSVVRVTDFGFSFFVDQQPSYIGGTLPYMAPEVVLGYPATCAADMWSLGCTVAKLVIRKELFVYDMDNDHVACCIEILGMPPKRMVKKAPRRASFFDPFGMPHWPSRTRVPGSVPLDHVLQGCGAQLVSFVKCCLQWDPKLRMTPDQALAHGWLKSKDTATTPTTATPTTTTATPTTTTATPTTTTATPTTTTATPTTTTATPTRTEEKPLSSSSSSSFSLLDHIYGERLKLVEEEVKEEKEGDETEKDEDKDKEEKDKDGNEEKDKYGNEEEDKHKKEEDTTEVEKTKEEIEEEEEKTEEEKEKTEEEVEEVQQPQEKKKHGGLARMGKTLRSQRSLLSCMVLCSGQDTAQ
ncbi:dual specificity tyrosine-phosphorylation-regulated kinase 4-like [Lampetra fluviatilis]